MSKVIVIVCVFPVLSRFYLSWSHFYSPIQVCTYEISALKVGVAEVVALLEFEAVRN